jgi:hypothetical protein
MPAEALMQPCQRYLCRFSPNAARFFCCKSTSIYHMINVVATLDRTFPAKTGFSGGVEFSACIRYHRLWFAPAGNLRINVYGDHMNPGKGVL